MVPDATTFLRIALPALLLGPVAFGGVACVVVGLRGRRSSDDPRCPRCGYSMRGLPAPRCPECGRMTSDPREFFRPRRRWRLVGVGGLLLALGAAAGAYAVCSEELIWRLLPRWREVNKRRLAGYVVKTYEHWRYSRPMEVRITGRTGPPLVVSGWRLELGVLSRDEARRVGVGEDVTGDGIRELVVSDYSGGAHCCDTLTIVELGAHAARVRATLSGEHSPVVLEDVDADGCCEAFVRDWTFAYWPTSFADSPAPRVVLRFDGVTYVPALDLMRLSAADAQALVGRAAEIRSEPPYVAAYPPAAYWDTLLTLLYGDQEQAARYFADAAWPPGLAGKEERLAEFRARLATSAYWVAIQAGRHAQR